MCSCEVQAADCNGTDMFDCSVTVTCHRMYHYRECICSWIGLFASQRNRANLLELLVPLEPPDFEPDPSIGLQWSDDTTRDSISIMTESEIALQLSETESQL